MIKSLRRKFILVTISVLFFVFLVVVVVMNSINYASMVNNLDHRIDMVSDDLKRPNDHGEAPFSARYFKIILNGDEVSVDLRHVATIDEKYALNAYNSVKKDSGFYNNFYYKKISNSTNTIYVFMDSSMENENFKSFMLISILVSIGGLIVISGLVIIFSKIVTKPIIENYQAKKEFISNINHEIKTPIAIIKASNEVIELESGKSEWTETIDKETIRMDELLKKLMFISKMDEDNLKMVKTNVNLADVAMELVSSFNALSKKENKEITANVLNCSIYAEEMLVGELISILLDNAIKYSRDESRILLNIYNQGKYVHLEVINEVDKIEVGEHNYLFERYYRNEDIAKHKQGYGLGLSIAKTICELHNAKIKCSSENDHTIKFEVIFKANTKI